MRRGKPPFYQINTQCVNSCVDPARCYGQPNQLQPYTSAMYNRSMPELWPFVLYALATARLTLMVTTDALFEEPRLWVLNRLVPEDEHGEEIPVNWARRKLAYLVTCIWCVPIWVASLVTYPLWCWHRDNPAAQAFITILALAMGASLLAKVGRDD